MSGLLHLAGVTKRFGGVTAVDDVSFDVPDGAIFGLIGPNGAGKTTLVNLISAYLAPDTGTIRFDGRELVGLPPHELTALGIARTYQNLRVFEAATVRENVLLGRHRWFTSQTMRSFFGRANERAQRATVAAFIRQCGLVEVAGRPVGDLSYGYRRRVEIARALATQPRLLLLDEPTAGMTRDESDEIAALVREIAATNVTVLLIDHNIRLIDQVCDQVAVLNWGRVVLVDSPAAVWNSAVVRSAYLGDAVTEESA